MTLVAGVDSSTQSCKVVVRDADDRCARALRARVAPRRHRGRPRPLVGRPPGRDRRRGRARRRRRPSPSAGSSTAWSRSTPTARWSATRCCGTTPARPRPPLDLIAELGDGDGAQALGRRDRLGARRLAHRDQAALAARRRAGERRARRRRRPPPRLADLAARRHGPGTPRARRARHRPLRRLRHRLLVARHRGLPARPARARARARRAVLPRVLGPPRPAPPDAAGGAVLGPGAGDNAAAALGARPAARRRRRSRSARPGVVSAIAADADRRRLGPGHRASPTPPARFLPLACTLNASRVLDAAARMLGVDHAGLSALALSAPAGADGLVLVPYLEGERTPNKPDATGALHGLRLANTTPAHLARAAVEGMLCAPRRRASTRCAPRASPVERLFLIGGGAQSAGRAARSPRRCSGSTSRVPTPGEYVADGAARQAAWVLSGAADAAGVDARPPRRPSVHAATRSRARPRAVRRGARAHGRRAPPDAGHDESPAPAGAAGLSSCVRACQCARRTRP